MRQGAGALSVSLLSLCWSGASHAGLTCPDIEQFLMDKAKGVVCQSLADLRATSPTATLLLPQPPVTPLNNSITNADGSALPGGAISSQTDPTVISVAPTPTSDPVPGIQVSGWFADDPTNQARFLLRFPADWNGKLVVAGASGTRSEFNGDWAWSNYVLPKGYAYASQNKGVLNLFVAGVSATQPASDPLSCRLNPSSLVWVHFYDNNADKPFTQWTYYMLQTASLAQKAVKVAYERPARRTYAVGTSNGGYQVRRAIEEGPDLFDGGVDWEGTSVNPNAANLLTDLPVALKNFPAYVAADYDPNSAAAQAIRAAGYPDDIVVRNAAGVVTDSLWSRHNTQFWEVTMCQWQKRFDPTYDTYGAGLGNYDYRARLTTPGVFADLVAVQTTGKIKKPLVTVAGTMDALLPIKNHSRGYQAAVDASRKGNNDRRNAQYRLYEVQNGNHIESYTFLFPQLKLIQPHAQKAFDVLVDHVEKNEPLPPSQCIPKDGSLSATPSQPGHCAKLLD
jgi:hypothetical protein